MGVVVVEVEKVVLVVVVGVVVVVEDVVVCVVVVGVVVVMVVVVPLLPAGQLCSGGRAKPDVLPGGRAASQPGGRCAEGEKL